MRVSLCECDQAEFVVAGQPRHVGMRSAKPDSSVTHIAPSAPIAKPCGPPSIETLRAALTPA
jgi:hypothetical protein